MFLLISGSNSATAAAKKVPTAAIVPASLSFPATAPGTIGVAQTVTLSNTGAATLKITGITLTGADPTVFSLKKTCGAKLSKGASCALSIAFKPTSSANFAATVSVADNAAGSPHTVVISGTGIAAPSSQTLIIEPDQGLAPIYNLLNSAKSTIDMTMYELVDTQCQQILTQQAAKGVVVRVILDQALEKTSNTPVYTYLNANGVKAVWANPIFQASHQKTITIDGKTTAVMSLNLTSRYYSTSRDLAIIETNPNDIAAIEKTFNADFTSSSITPPNGDDLIWSPTNSLTSLLAMINASKSTLEVENEEMGDAQIVAALESAAKRGVQVEVAMTNGGNYATEFNALKAAGVKLSTYTPTAPLYIHAKMILVDNGQSGQQAFVGSENFSNPSLTENRELGLSLTDPAILQSLNTTFASDFKGGTPWP
ncbi:MAG TPA: phospholipase D-like domain-containing protein [Edaphobacter sp.]|nr:phospholipase D-like domain-containing protein [Edaphobacter sp.]